jgi:hypothetical protein
VTASAVDRLLIADSEAAHAGLLAHAPGEPSRLLATGAGLSEAYLDTMCGASVARFLQALAVARFDLTDYFAECCAIGNARAAVLHQAGLSCSCRAAASDGANAVAHLDEAIDGSEQGQDVYRQTARRLATLLAAAAGKAPCIDAEGDLYVPELPQRRRAPRARVGARCTVEHARRRTPALLRDISVGGLGLASGPALTVGEAIAVSLDSGRRFAGRIAWARGGSAGVVLDHPLLASDPLLFG